MIRLATVFTGIGAIEQALKRMDLDHEIVFACDNGDINIFDPKIPFAIRAAKNRMIQLEHLINKTVLQTNISGLSHITDLKEHFDRINLKFDALNLNIESLRKYINDLRINENNYRFNYFDIESNYNILKVKDKKIDDVLKLYSDNIESLDILDSVILSERIFRKFKVFSKKIIGDDIKEKDKVLKKLALSESEFLENFKNLDSIALIVEIEIFKKCVELLKNVIDDIAMLSEKIKTIEIHNNLNEIVDYKEKKDYVDSLYKSKLKSNFVRQSYFANYKINEEDFHWNISFLDGKQYRDKVDLFVGGSPCQSFSLVGKQRGLQDTRGTLFYEFARLVKEIQPKVFIYENVKAVLSNDNGQTWEVMKATFEEIGYEWKQMTLNAKNFGIPQNRERIFVVGFRKDLELKEEFVEPTRIELKTTLKDFLVENVEGKYYLNKKGVKFVSDKVNLNKKWTQINGDIQLCQTKNQQFNWHGDFIFEDKDVEKTELKKQIELLKSDDEYKEMIMNDLKKYFLSEKVKAYVLASGTEGFYSKPEIDLDIARPLLKTMHKMHRAGIDNYVTTFGRIRKLTPRECLRLMGFSDNFNIVVSDTQVYQQTGNSIVVDVLINIMKNIIKVYPGIEDDIIEKPEYEQMSMLEVAMTLIEE
ncbi:MAG: DNA cytosine methyltransferase [Sarcina sp.]